MDQLGHLEQQKKGNMKQYQSELHSQALCEASITMEASHSEQSIGTEEAQHKGQQVLDLTHNKRKQMNLELLQPKDQAEKDLMLSKYKEDPNPPLL